ncbi:MULTISPECIES: hypothetical protein [unclassified Agarivorans]|uniref:hypothetical protein n=1 Tax=unclassified Agarivorans TaxID=2636026 RepID=UPI003D7DD5EC
MNAEMTILEWTDTAIGHRLWLEKQSYSSTRLCLKVVKDVVPEILYLDLVMCHDKAVKAWQGQAFAVSSVFDDGHLYSQVRCLLNLSDGCVLWLVNHIKLPNGQKMSADKLTFVPGMRCVNGALAAID